MQLVLRCPGNNIACTVLVEYQTLKYRVWQKKKNVISWKKKIARTDLSASRCSPQTLLLNFF